MIEHIRGKLIQKELGHVLVEAGGLGYGMDISLATFESLPETGEECALFTYLYVREDSFRLFGFGSNEERDIFEVLIATSGIGPKLSLAILSHMPIQDFSNAILYKDIQKLVKIPAIGKKTAERLCVELKDKLKGFASQLPGGKQPGSAAPPPAGPIEDAISALIALGVKPSTAGNAIHKASRNLGDDAKVEDLVKEGLKYRR